MADTELLTLLGEVDLFHGLSPKVLARIAEAGHESVFEPGDAVVLQGEKVSGFKAFSPAGVEMHVILDGTARVSVNGSERRTLVPGDYFGELSLVDGGPRSADVVAGAAGLTTLALTKWTFEDLLERHPEVAVPMLRVMCGRLRAREAAESDSM